MHLVPDLATRSSSNYRLTRLAISTVAFLFSPGTCAPLVPTLSPALLIWFTAERHFLAHCDWWHLKKFYGQLNNEWSRWRTVKTRPFLSWTTFAVSSSVFHSDSPCLVCSSSFFTHTHTDKHPLLSNCSCVAMLQMQLLSGAQFEINWKIYPKSHEASNFRCQSCRYSSHFTGSVRWPVSRYSHLPTRAPSITLV